MNAPDYQYDLFVSFAESDRAWVEGYLLDALQAAGVRTMTEAAFTLGVARLPEFERALKSSRRTLLVLSPAYVADEPNLFVELLAQAYGLESGTWPVIPLILHPVQLPVRLAFMQSLDATDPDSWLGVVNRLTSALGHTLTQTSPVRRLCPYPGMRPFIEEDTEHFYGRNLEIEEVIQRLRQVPLLTIIGASGSGKSSLVFAGVIPALRRSLLFGLNLSMRTIRPGVDPIATLARAFECSSAAPEDILTQARQLAPLLLVVDQFEEIFALANRQNTGRFIRLLLSLHELSQVYIILTVRADYYADLMNTELWPLILRQRLELAPLTSDALRNALVRPAESVGVYLEAALVERLLAESAAEPGALPFLQEIMVLLWEQLERNFLPLRAYEALVPPQSRYSEQRTGLQVAMSRRADDIFRQLRPEEQRIARRIFLRLVQFGEGRADTRRQQPLAWLKSPADDDVQFNHALNHLTSNRLLVLSSSLGEEPMVDLANEALITAWPTLRSWLDERRQAELTRRRLEQMTTEWLRMGRGRGGLLDEVELIEAEAWLQSQDAEELGMSVDFLQFVRASQAARQWQWFQPVEWLRKKAIETRAEWTTWQRARTLEGCSNIEMIGTVHRATSVDGLSAPISDFVNTLLEISRDVDKALKVEGDLRQSLAIRPISERLQKIAPALKPTDQRGLARFLVIANQWRDIVVAHQQSLLAAAHVDREIESPYVVGNPLDENQATFVGRMEISERIENLLLDSRRPPLLLYGQRRMGKTSLLKNLGRMLPSSVVPLFVDLQGPASLADNHAGFLYNLARAMTNSAARQRNLHIPPLSREMLQNEPFTVFDEWLDQWEKILGERTALLTLDEFEALDRALGTGRLDEAAVLGMLRHLIQHRPRFKILIAGSHTLGELRRWSSYLINVQVVHISYLHEEEARRLIEHPVPNFPLVYEPDASQHALDLTHGHPFLLQALCHEIVLYKNTQTPTLRGLACVEDVEIVAPKVLRNARAFFDDIESHQMDDVGRHVLRTMAAKGKGAVVESKLLMHGLTDEAQLQRTLPILEQIELIEPLDRGYRFQVEMIRRWFTQGTS